MAPTLTRAPTLSKLKVGVDVPWVTSWTAEAVLGVGPCPTVGGRMAVLQQDKPGYGKPIYSMNHYRRQRASVRGLLCPMCGEPTPEDDRWSLTARLTTAGEQRANGLAITVPPDIPDERGILSAAAIAPGHLECMTRSHEQCPHLRADPAAELMRFPAKWYVSIMRGEVKPDLSHLSRKQQKRFKAAPPPALVDQPPIIALLQLCGIMEA